MKEKSKKLFLAITTNRTHTPLYAKINYTIINRRHTNMHDGFETSIVVH